MGFLTKIELKKQLQQLGIKVEGSYVRKCDIENLIYAGDVIQFSSNKKQRDRFSKNEDDDESPKFNLHERNTDLVEINDEIDRILKLADRCNPSVDQDIIIKCEEYLDKLERKVDEIEESWDIADKKIKKTKTKLKSL